MMPCHQHKKGSSRCDIALVGNPNTGKSCLFNHLTGVGATVSNFPGTTIEIIEGRTTFEGSSYLVADLPGAYSLAAATPDEQVTTKYIKLVKPIVINVVSALALERNLYLTMQLIKNGAPMVVALNFYQEALNRGVKVNVNSLSRLLGVPVIPIDAVNGWNIPKLMKAATGALPIRPLQEKSAEIIARKALRGRLKARSISDTIDQLTTEPATGYFVLFAVMAVLFCSLIFAGGYLSGVIDRLFTAFIGSPIKHFTAMIPLALLRTVLEYGLDGINAALQVALPYITIFYFLMALLEDSGYLPRMAYLLDRAMHRLGLHGKSVIPMMLGFGCTVPAILCTRILPSKRERILTAVLVNLVPCSARTAVILGSASHFIGWQFALLIYGIVLLIIFLVGAVLGRYLPGNPEGLVLEMPEYRMPRLVNVLSKTWMRLKDFMLMAAPLVIGGSMILGVLVSLNLLDTLTKPFQPLIGGWLMLPAAAGITLVYGILRKELALEMLVLLGGTANLLLFMSPLQIFVFALVVTLYFPCISTFTVIKREFGLKTSLFIVVLTIAIAMITGGLVGRLLLFSRLLA